MSGATAAGTEDGGLHPTDEPKTDTLATGTIDTSPLAPPTFDIVGDSFEARGNSRGALVGETLQRHFDVHLRLFALAGHSEQQVRSLALRMLDSSDQWWPGFGDEVTAIASASGVEAWQAAALQARTELLIARRECTVIAQTQPPAVVQAWDWHNELRHAWHAQRVTGTRLAFAGITEHGICAKIGRNEAGLGLTLAILSHADDTPSGVPIHVLCYRLLAEAASLDEAEEIARSARLGGSSAITLVSREGTWCLELCPEGVAAVAPINGWLLHTNHFIASEFAQDSRVFRGDPDSHERMQLLEERTGHRGHVNDASELVPLLRTTPGNDIGNICCVPREDAEFGVRWETLATVTVTPERLSVQPGSPIQNAAEVSGLTV